MMSAQKNHIKRKVLGEATKTESGEMVFRCLVAGVPDRDGDVFPSLSSLDIASYLTNPVLKFHHNRPGNIGHTKIWSDDTTLFMVPVFSESDPVAVDIKAKVLEGTYRACSVGYIERAVRPNKHGGVDVLDAELVEISITDIPANQLAVRVKTVEPDSMMMMMMEVVAGLKADIAAIRVLLESTQPPPHSLPAEQNDTSTSTVVDSDSMKTFFDDWIKG